jgi:hypothetical integral membrane protein (TIGR02206 family)
VNRFVLFGAEHFAALALTAAVALALVVAARRGSRLVGRLLRYTLALGLLAATAAVLGHWWSRGLLSVWDVLPLHLCDFLILVAAFTLVTLQRTAAELLFFWAGTGTVLAMLGPDLQTGFPSWAFVGFFLLHGLVVIAAAVVTFGFDRRPRDGAPWRVFALTNAYALVVALVNAWFGTNYLFLRAKPQAATVLDWFGPWPVYLFAGEAAALALFLLLDAPFRAARRASRDRLRPPRSADRVSDQRR